MNKKQKTHAETLGSRLAGLLSDDYGISPERLAEIVEMSGAGIRDIIKGKSNPYRGTIDKIAGALGTTYDYLMKGEGARLPKGKKELATPKAESNTWKDEAWDLAREQLREKDSMLKSFAVSLDRLTQMMMDSKVPFLKRVDETAELTGTNG